MNTFFKTLTCATLAVTSGLSQASLHQYQSNFADRSYSNGWHRSYSGVVFEWEAMDFMIDGAANHLVGNAINSDDLVWLYSEYTGNFKGSNEITSYYSHDLYHSGFLPPVATSSENPGSCEFSGWVPGHLSGGFAWGGSIYLGGPSHLLLPYINDYLERGDDGLPDILFAYVGSCPNGQWIIALPQLSMIKYHSTNK